MSTVTNPEHLLPCPFCGEPPRTDAGMCHAWCLPCMGIPIGWIPVSLWNRRAAPPGATMEQVTALLRGYERKVDLLHDLAVDCGMQKDDEGDIECGEYAELIRDSIEAWKSAAEDWHKLTVEIAGKLGCNVRSKVDGNQHVIDRAAYLSSMFTVDAYTATAKAEAERDAARAEVERLRQHSMRVEGMHHEACAEVERLRANCGEGCRIGARLEWVAAHLTPPAQAGG